MVDNLALEHIKLIALTELERELVYPQNSRVYELGHFNPFFDTIAFKMVAEFLGKLKKDTIIKYPANWKESLKERFLPRFLKSRFPIIYEERAIYKVCPHINTKFSDNPDVHLKFLKD
jgi:hypothetical protein